MIKHPVVYNPKHPRASSSGHVYEHILVVEVAIGKFLEGRFPIHHVDEDPSNNSNVNLVVCQDQAYHHLLHQRRRALTSCGHADWRKCHICKKYSDPIDMLPRRCGFVHRSCFNNYRAKRRANKSMSGGIAA